MCAVKPKRSRSGGGSRPARVVAPTRVNGGSSSGMAVAPGPLPTMTSTRKSSIAMYSISSAGRDMRWISSRKRTSPSWREERIAARSPACWMAGPLVMRIGAPISAAMIIERVVLPRPGAPESSTWSAVAPRARAARSTRSSCSRTFSWPMNSSRSLGRRAASTAWSSRSAAEPDQPLRGGGASVVSSQFMAVPRGLGRVVASVLLSIPSWARAGGSAGAVQGLQGRLQQLAHLGRALGRLGLRGHGGHRLVGLAGGVPEADQGGVQLVAPAGVTGASDGAGRRSARRAGP